MAPRKIARSEASSYFTWDVAAKPLYVPARNHVAPPSFLYHSVMHHVYLIEAESSGKRYIGYTTDLKRRIAEHNNHKNISTAKEAKWKLIYCETYVNKMDALGREKFLKSGSGWRFLRKQLQHYLEERVPV